VDSASSDRHKAAEQLERYLATAGEDGHLVDGREHLILTTIGRRSGEERSTPLIFGTDEDRYLVVGSFAGRDVSPNWYLNLVVTPEVNVQVKADRFVATARIATATERPRLWALMCGVYPTYADYQKITDREIPVVILERHKSGSA
jgi:deazaflavin-dependent oxidoreductase (nitroreductase family)